MNYLAVYEQRLAPLLDVPLSHYLDESRRHLPRQRRKKRLAVGGGVLAVALFVVAGLVAFAYVQAKERKSGAGGS